MANDRMTNDDRNMGRAGQQEDDQDLGQKSPGRNPNDQQSGQKGAGQHNKPAGEDDEFGAGGQGDRSGGQGRSGGQNR